MTATVSAVAGLDAAEATLARWQAEVAAKGAELTDLRGRAGEEALDDPAAAAGLAAAISLLSGEVQVAELAVVPAAARVEAARRAVLRERAEALTARVTRLRVAAAKRQERTDRLLAEGAAGRDVAVLDPGDPVDAELGERVGVDRGRADGPCRFRGDAGSSPRLGAGRAGGFGGGVGAAG
jgi:hypothetical protein